jgi:AcrR family transcriptional regulator
MAETRARAPRTARERARAELTREIKEEARRQLAESGAGGLSLRAVARELGMVSSALYRYFPSRDELLTALIIDAYDAVGEAAEQAIAAPGGAQAAGGPGGGAGAGAGPARARWIAACHAIRAWARSNPHEYALIYGSPVPGYRAPQATVGPAARVPLAFMRVLASAAVSGELAGGAAADGASVDGYGVDGTGGGQGEPLPAGGELAAQAAAIATALDARELPPDAVVRAAIAWTQLFGMISWELFGQFVGSFDPADALFDYAAGRLAAFVGLR